MSSSLYDADTLVWSEQQAALLRRLAAGERVNEAVDWENVIEEIEDVGRAQFTGCESLLRQALVHFIKLATGPEQPSAHWRGEIATFLADAGASYSPSMRQRIDLQRLYAKAIDQASASVPEEALSGLPESCPVTLDDLLRARPDIVGLARRFAPSA